MLIGKSGARHILCGILLLVTSGLSAGEMIAVVQGVSVGSTVTLDATVISSRVVTFTAQRSGRIDSIAGGEGDHFPEGERLIAINDDDLQASRSAAMANLMYAGAALRTAEIQYAREWINPFSWAGSDPWGNMGPMYPGYINPMREIYGNYDPWVDWYARLYELDAYVEQARSSLKAAGSLIAKIDTGIRNTRSIAPFDGVITKKLIEVGDTVHSGQPLLEYSDLNRMQIRVDVPARLMPGIEKGMILAARLGVEGVETGARIARVFPFANEGRQTVTVKLDLGSGVVATPGMHCEVDIEDVKAKMLDIPVVPIAALIRRGSLPAVYVLNTKNLRELRVVRTGDHVGTDRVSILSGLRVGERIYIRQPNAVENKDIRN